MKKILVLLLVLAMLIPMGLVAGAEEAVATKPFTALGWSDLDREQFPNMDGLVTANLSTKGDQVFLSFGGTQNPEKMAEKLKETMEARPEGLRYLHVFGPGIYAMSVKENVLFAENGVSQMKTLFTDLIEAYKAINGPLDGLIIDVEHFDMYAYNIWKDLYSNDQLIYSKLVEDERYATEVRPLLVEYGFPFYENVTEYTPEIYSICNDIKSQYPTATQIWDNVMDIRIANYMNDALYEPLKKCYPDATMSDYQTKDMAAWMNAPGTSSEISWYGGNAVKIGNVSNDNTYAYRPTESFFKNAKGEIIYNNPYSYNPAVFERVPFNMFMFETNMFKMMYASTDTKTVSIWVSEYDYNTEMEGTISNTPYYTETLLHAGLLDPEPFLVYMYRPEFDTQEDYDYRSKVISQILDELTRVVGAADREPIELPISWNSDFMLSGMTAGGKNYWRITPDTTKVSLEDFKVEGSDPTFSVSGQTVTFPGGKIIEDGKVDEVGTCGYWIETAKDVMPTVTSLTDRYAQNPSFIENFDSYEVGTAFSATTARESAAWTVKLDGKNKLTIVENGSGKAVTFSGSTTLQNVKMVDNITAGDSYAEQQAWEVSLTIPEGMTGEMVLLNTNGKKGDTKDGGFKIADGKVYYCNAGTYEEISGVTVSAGTYTFRRVVDFTNADAFTSSYYVLDAKGQEIGSKQNAAMVTFKIPITSIGISSKDVTGTVLVDEYKLYPVGTAEDLSLYDAKTGKSVEGIWAASTAYRLSWMNASGSESKVTVLYDVYEGDKLISEGNVAKEINRLPGTDGVETGIVEAKAGQSVKVYVKSDKVSGGPNGTDGTGDPNEPSVKNEGGINPAVYLLIASVVVAVTLVVVAAVVVSKPKKAKPAAPADDAIAENAIPEKKPKNKA